MNLFLIGYRCTGKTTIGKSVALTMGWSFVDSDRWVTKECGKSIKNIVGTQGWEAFRRAERSVIKQICKKDRQVVATGGGVVLDAVNIKSMKTSGMVIWLGATAETIQKRMLQDKSTGNFRPALTQKGSLAEIEELLAERSPYYERASDFSVQTDDMPVDVITSRIIDQLNEANIDKRCH